MLPRLSIQDDGRQPIPLSLPCVTRYVTEANVMIAMIFQDQGVVWFPRYRYHDITFRCQLIELWFDGVPRTRRTGTLANCTVRLPK